MSNGTTSNITWLHAVCRGSCTGSFLLLEYRLAVFIVGRVLCWELLQICDWERVRKSVFLIIWKQQCHIPTSQRESPTAERTAWLASQIQASSCMTESIPTSLQKIWTQMCNLCNVRRLQVVRAWCHICSRACDSTLVFTCSLCMFCTIFIMFYVFLSLFRLIHFTFCHNVRLTCWIKRLLDLTLLDSTRLEVAQCFRRIWRQQVGCQPIISVVFTQHTRQ